MAPPGGRAKGVALMDTDSAWNFLSGDLARDRRNLRLVMETVGELYGELGTEERMRRAVDRAVLVTEAERGFLLIEEDGELEPRVVRDAAGSDLSLGELYSRRIVGDVWSTGNPVRLEYDLTHGQVRPWESIDLLKLRSSMAMRLQYGDHALGVLYVDAKVQTKTFAENEYRVFLALGGLVATALENTHLEGDRTERRRLERNLELARRVQERLLPREIQAPAELDVYGTALYCDKVGGDYYDVLPQENGTVALVLGDVSGHDVSAAMQMVAARMLLRRLTEEGGTLETTFRTMNAILEQDMQEQDFLTLFVGMLDPDRLTLRYASAGHCPALLRRRDGTGDELQSTGTIIGMFQDLEFETRGPIPLAPGDVLFLYTDGLTEGMDDARRTWGEERLHASVDRHAAAGLDAESLVEAVLADAAAWRRPGSLEDDVTALAVRVR